MNIESMEKLFSDIYNHIKKYDFDFYISENSSNFFHDNRYCFVDSHKNELRDLNKTSLLNQTQFVKGCSNSYLVSQVDIDKYKSLILNIYHSDNISYRHLFLDFIQQSFLNNSHDKKLLLDIYLYNNEHYSYSAFLLEHSQTCEDILDVLSHNKFIDVSYHENYYFIFKSLIGIVNNKVINEYQKFDLLSQFFLNNSTFFSKHSIFEHFKNFIYSHQQPFLVFYLTNFNKIYLYHNKIELDFFEKNSNLNLLININKMNEQIFAAEYSDNLSRLVISYLSKLISNKYNSELVFIVNHSFYSITFLNNPKHLNKEIVMDYFYKFFKHININDSFIKSLPLDYKSHFFHPDNFDYIKSWFLAYSISLQNKPIFQDNDIVKI